MATPERRVTALDGLRAVAVLMVMAYHGGLAGLRVGGYYGVDIFFVLSGYLITGLLISEQRGRGRIRLGRFWGRRAVRLLPGLVLMMAVTTLYVRFVAPSGRYPGFVGDAASVLVYGSNWHFVASSSDYFAATGAPSLLLHTWSLAIEEQFYLLWPLVLILMAVIARTRSSRLVGAIASVGALASAATMAGLYRAGAQPSRLYYGTDTHASSLMVGAALAGWLASSRTGRPLAAQVSRIVFVAGALVLGWAATSMGSDDPAAYQGGFLLVALAAGALILTLVGSADGGRLAPARLLEARPLVYLGRISYGMYLWYFPLFAVIDRSATGLTGPPLLAVRVAADVAIASLSWHLVETPLRLAARDHRRRSIRTGLGLVASVSVIGALLFSLPAATGAGAVPDRISVGASSDYGATPGPSVLIVGDSTGLTLGLGLSLAADDGSPGMRVVDRSIMGCGVTVSDAFLVHDSVRAPKQPCRPATPIAGRWYSQLASEVDQLRPAVVVLAAGRWETSDMRLTATSSWTDILEPSGRRAVLDGLEEAATVASRSGARLLLATAPCFESGETPDGRNWPEDDPARLKAYDELLFEVASAHAGDVAVIDLGALVCPGGRYTEHLDGVTVRAPDGIHYPFFDVDHPTVAAPDTEAQTKAFGEWLLARIRPRLQGGVGLSG